MVKKIDSKTLDRLVEDLRAAHGDVRAPFTWREQQHQRQQVGRGQQQGVACMQGIAEQVLRLVPAKM